MAEFGNIYDKLEGVFQRTGGKCCVDSAFGSASREFLYKSSQDIYGSNALTRRERVVDLQRMREATSARQTSEWGMRALQASFPRLKDKFIYEERGERRIVLKMYVLLYNLRARTVGINQIRNVYMPYLDLDASENVLF